LRSQVMVLRHTGSRMSAMLNLSVSAPPFATQTQYPITSNTARRRYCTNFHANRPAHTDSHSAATHTRCQLSSKK
jgi:hypothetical protein